MESQHPESHANESGSSEPQPDSPAARRKALVDQGDLLGLIEELVRTYPTRALRSAEFAQITHCVDELAKANPARLEQAMLSRVESLASLLYLRIEATVRGELEDGEALLHGQPAGVPRVVIDSGLLERIERLARFLMQIADLRARLRHLEDLSDDPIRSARRRTRATLGGRGGEDGRVARDLVSPRVSDQKTNLKFPNGFHHSFP